MKIFTLLEQILNFFTGFKSRSLSFNAEGGMQNDQPSTVNRQLSTVNDQPSSNNAVLNFSKPVPKGNALVQIPSAPAKNETVAVEYKYTPLQKKIIPVQTIKPVVMQNFFAIVKKIFSLSDHPKTLLENLNEGYHPGCSYGTAGPENISRINQHYDVANSAASFAFIPLTPTAMSQLEKKPVKTVTGRSGIFGIIMLMSSLCFITNLSAQTTITQTVPGNYTFTVPAGVTQITVQAWGAGGAGGSGNNGNGSRGGGGGGAFTTRTITGLTGGTVFNFTVGAGGVPNSNSGTNPTTAGPSYFGNTNPGNTAGNQVLAAAGGFGSSGNGGAAGLASASNPNTAGIAFSGGAGGAGVNNGNGGGGGGSAGATGAGGSGNTTVTGGTAGAGGGTVGGTGGATNNSGSSGNIPGSGGGGKGNNGNLSGSGAAGEIIITYTCPTYSISGVSVTPNCQNVNDIATLTASPTSGLPVGTYTVTYNLSGANNVTGATTSMTVSAAGTGSFTIPAAQIPVTGATSILITQLNSSGCISAITTGNSANISVLVSPSITNQTTPAAGYCLNSTPTDLSVTADGGSSTITQYQWFSNTTASTTGGTSVAIHTTSATTDSYTPLTNTAGTLFYYVAVTNNNNCTITSAVSGAIQVFNATTITTQPSSTAQIYCQTGSTVNALTVQTNAGGGGNAIATYQWFSNTAQSTTGSTLVQTTNTTSTTNSFTPPLTTTGGLFYYVVVTNNRGCTVTSGFSGLITVNSSPSVTGQTTPAATYCLNSTPADLSVTADPGSGATISTYQWFSNTTASTTGGTSVAIHTTAATTDTYTPLTTASGTLFYYVVITNSNNCTIKSAVSGAIKVQPATAQPVFTTSSASVCFGQNNVSYIVASDPNVDTYNWSYSGTGATITGTTNSVTISFANPSTSGTLSVTPHNVCGDGTPQTLAITVNPLPLVSNFTLLSATSPIASGNSSTVTIQSNTLITGTYTVVYNLSAPNAGTGITASMSFTAGSPGTGTFSVPLANGGVSPTTITITALQNTASCSSAISTNNTASVLVNPTTVSQTLGGTVGASHTFTAPCFVTSVNVQMWGAGGGGGGAINNGTSSAGGGGGGAFTLSNNISLTNNTATYFIAGGGTAGTPGNTGGTGQNSTFTGATTANGGTGGVGATGGSSGAGGTGGTGGTHNGGNGAAGVAATAGGGGGGAAGTGANGSNGTGSTAGAGGTGTIPGGAGGAGATNNNGANGVGGNVPGGGGGGAHRVSGQGNTFNGGAGAAGQIIVSYNCPLSVTLSYASPICQSPGTVSPIASVCGGTYSSTAGLSINAGTGAITPSTSTPGTYTVTYTIAAAGGCNGLSTTTSVTINPLPAVTISTAGDVTTFCTGSSLLLTANAATATSYQWNLNGSPITNETNSTYTAIAAGNYTVTVGDANGCSNTSAITALSNFATATAAISGTQTICSGSTANLSVSLTGAAPFSFTYNDGTNSFPVTGVGTTGTFTAGSPFVYTLTVTPPANTTASQVAVNYTITAVNDANGCSGGTFSGTGTVNVNPLPTASMQLFDQDINVITNGAICSGGTVFLSVTFPGSSPGGYQFSYTDGTNSFDGPTPPYNGSATLTLNPTATTPTTLNYSLTNVTDLSTGCASTSAPELTGSATLLVNPLPTATISVDNPAVCINGTSPNITLTGANGTAPYTFTYTVNGGAPNTISSENPSSLVTIPVSTSVAGTFTFVLTNVQDNSSTQCQQTVTGQQASVLVRPATAIATDVTSPDPVCAGGTAPQLSVVGSGTLLTYQWYINNTNSNTGGTQVTNGSGGLTDTFTPDVSTAGTFYYYVVVTGTCGSATSSVATVLVNPNTAITNDLTDPAPTCAGATAPILSISATGTGTLHYAWFSNTSNSNTGGTAVGTDASTFTPDVSVVGTFFFYVVISSDCGSATSAVATVVVNPNTAITGDLTDPAPVCAGSTAPELSITATGTGTLHYAWFKNATNSTTGGTAVGTDASTFSPDISTAGTFFYYVVVSSDCGSATSVVATVVVNPNTAITSDLSDPAPVCAGGTGPQLSISATGTGTLHYAWFSNSSNSTIGGTAVGTDASTFTPDVSTAGTFFFYVVISSDCGSATSAVATVVVNANASITSDLTDPAPVCAGGTAPQLSIGVSGVGTLHYAWFSNTTNSTSGGTAVGTDASTFTPDVSTAGTFFYYVVVSSGCGSVTSAVATVVVNPNTAITSDLSSPAPTCAGATAPQLSISATGTGTLHYAWFSNTSNSNTGGTAVGADASTFTPDVSAAGTFFFYVVVSSDCGSATSAVATVVVNSNTSITGDLSDPAPVCAGGTAPQLSITATGIGTLHYAWFKNGTNSTIGGAAVGTDASTFTPDVSTAGTFFYYVVVSSDCGSSTSAVATVIVNPNTAITSDLSSPAPVCAGGTAPQLSITATGTGTLHYAWFSNTSNSNVGGSAVGTDASTFTPNVGTAGTFFFYVVVSGDCGSTTSAVATVVVNINTSITSDVTSPAPICAGGTAPQLSITADGSNLIYKWFINNTNSNIGGTPVSNGSGGTTATFTPDINTAGTFFYYAVVTGDCGSATSAVATVVVNPNTAITSNLSSPAPVCAGAAAPQLSVTATGTGTVHYAWFKNTINSTSGGTAVGTDVSTFTPDVSSAGTLFYYVIVTSDCGSATSAVATVTVSSNPTITQIQKTDIKCFGDVNGTVTISVNGGTPGYHYTLSSTTTSFTANNTTGSFTGLAADTYNVIVTDANGCSAATGSATVGAPAKLVAGSTTTDVTCFNMNDGTATITASGGTGFYHYSIDGNSSVPGDNLISKKFTGLIPGPHGVVVTDDNGCSTSVIIFTINQPTQLTAIASAGTLSCNSSTTSLFVIANGGTPPYTYSLNGGTPQSGFVFTVGAGPSYIVTVTDAHNCTVNTASVSVSAPTQVTIAFSNVNPAGCVSPTGSFTVTASGGAGNYMYSLNGGGYQPGGTFSGLAANSYLVTAKDGSGCTASGIVTIGQATPPNVYTVSGGGSTCTGQAFPVMLSNAQFGISYYLLLNGVIQPPGGISSLPGSPFSFGNFTAPGTYTVIAYDPSSGCQIPMSGSATIASGTLPIAYSVTGGGNYCSGGQGLHVGLQNSESGVTYQLFNGAAIASGLFPGSTGSQIDFGVFQAGTYTVVAKNAAGCTNNMTGSATIAVTPTPATVTLIAPNGVNDCTGLGADIQLVGSQTGVDYQLFVNNVAIGSVIPGTGSQIDLGNKPSGTYTIVGTSHTGGCVGNVSNSITVNSGAKPTAFTVTGGGSYCSGPGIAIGLSNSETGVSYVLIFNGTTNVGSATGTTGNSLSFGNYTALGSYSVMATNTTTNCTNQMSNSVSILAGTLPTAYNVTGTGSYCSNALGVKVNLSSSDAGISYQLLLNGGNIGAAQTGNGSPLDFGFQTAGTYTVLATNPSTGCTRTMNGSAVITLNSAVPSILTQPLATQTACVGNSVTFSVVASADATGFQWLKNSVIIPNANGSSFNIPSVSPSDQATYSVIVSGTCGNITSNDAALIVNSAVAINTQPLSQSICGSVVLSVGASNATGYQWFLGINSISGANSSTYTALTPGSYTVVVSGPCGAPQTSNAAVLTAPAPVNITTQPQSQTFTGSNLLSVVASNATGYQWFLGGSSISGANNPTYTATAAGTYTVLVTGLCGSQQLSNPAVLSTCTPVAINTQPVGGSFCGSMLLTVSASNATGYQWFLGINSIGGANGPSYTATAPGSYTVVVSGPCGSPVTSNAAVLTAAPVVVINTQPVGGSFCGSKLLSVGASNATGYQWFLGASSISGANLSTYTATAPGSYTVVVSGNCGSPVTSNAAVLTANGGVTITTQPVNKSICSGGSATFSVTASNANGYQWFRGNTSIGGATNPTFTTGTAGNYHVVVSGNCGSPVTSNTVSLSVNAGVTIVTQPVSTQICAGGTESFSVVANNATGYQWYRNGNLIIGATHAQYFTGTTGRYDVRVFDACGGSVMSDFAFLTINGPVAITSQPQSVAICSGGTATFSVSANNANGFQWYRNNNPIPGGVNTSYTTGVAGNYKVVVTGGCGGPITSNTATLSFLPAPNVAAVNGTGSICAGTTVRFTDATSGGTWSSSNTSVATVTATGFVRGVSGGSASIRYTVSNGCTSNTASRNITVNTVPVVDAITGSSSVCAGSTTNLSDGTSNGDWNSSNTSIATVNNNGRVRGIRNGNVTISYTVQNSCGSTTVNFPFTVGCSGIQKNSLATTNDDLTLTVSVSPNPSQNFFTLIAQSSVLDAPITISIFDMQNRLVDKHTASVGEAVRFGDRFAAGMYIVQVTQGGLQKTVKVVKN